MSIKGVEEEGPGRIGSDFRDHLKEILKDPRARARFEEARANRRIAERVACLRKARRMTQTELAKRVGTTQSAISRLENYEDRSPSLDLLRRIAEGLDAELRVDLVPDELVGPVGEVVGALLRTDAREAATLKEEVRA